MKQLNEQLAIVATIDPDAYTANTYYTDDIDMKYWKRLIFIVMAGTLGSSATIDFSLVEGASASPTAAFATAKAITQLTQASTDDDKQAIIELDVEDVAATTRYVRGKLVVGTATSDAGVIVLGEGRFEPASDFDLASVDEIVTA